MKKMAVLAVLALACSPMQTRLPSNRIFLTSECPRQAHCTLAVSRNKRLRIDPAADGIRYTMADQPGMNVITYQYNKIVKGNLQDAGYREEILFEYDGTRNVSLSDGDLQKVRMLFGRFCYCKGQTGYFAVHQGHLSIDANGRGELVLTVGDVPHITTQIAFELQ